MSVTTFNDSNGSARYIFMYGGDGTSPTPFVNGFSLVTDTTTGNAGVVEISNIIKKSQVSSGQYTCATATVALQMDPTGVAVTRSLLLARPSSQTGSVFVGGSTVSNTNGYEFKTTDAPITLYVTNTNTVYLYFLNASDKVCWLAQ